MPQGRGLRTVKEYGLKWSRRRSLDDPAHKTASGGRAACLSNACLSVWSRERTDATPLQWLSPKQGRLTQAMTVN